MKKLANLKGVNALSKTQQKEIFGGCFTERCDPGGGGGGDSVQCQCVFEGGTASGPEANCDSCFSYCQTTYGSRLISSWCFG